MVSDIISIFNRVFNWPEIPKSGEQWYESDGSPWPRKNKSVKILEVKGGWVRYYLGHFQPDERVRLLTFLSNYSKLG